MNSIGGLGVVIGEDLWGMGGNMSKHKHPEQSISFLLKKKPTSRISLMQSF